MSVLVNDFSQYATGVQPSDWTRRWAGTGTWTVVAGAGKDGIKGALQSTGLTAVRNAISWNAVDSMPGRENMEILARLKSTVANNQDFQFMTRGSGLAAAETGYRGGVGNNTRRTDRYDGGTAYTWGVVNTNAGPALAAETWYLMRYRINGATITISLWADDGVTTEPATPNFTLVDPAPNLVPGWAGMFQSIVNGKTTVDEIAFASNGDTATFVPAIEIVITDALGLTDPGSSLQAAEAVTVIDKLGLNDALVYDLVSTFNIAITDRMGLTDTPQINLAAVRDIAIIDSIDLLDDALTQTLIPGDPPPVDPGGGSDPGPTPDPSGAIARGTAIITELVAAGYTMGTIMDRERLRLLEKTGANPVGMTLQDLYRLAGERPRL
jgi:hypothetical protein